MSLDAERTGRDQILGEVRAQLARDRRLATSTTELPVVQPTRESDPTDLAGRVAAFEARLRAVGGHVHHVADAGAAARQIERITSQQAAPRIGVSDAPLLDEVRSHLPAALLLSPDATRDELLACDAGLTTAQWGIAETGSLVLDSSAERHRWLSLLPPIHIAVLPADRIVATLAEALATARGSEPAPPRAITMITGPSRTADIELTLVVGVHGPRELHVLLLAPQT